MLRQPGRCSRGHSFGEWLVTAAIWAAPAIAGRTTAVRAKTSTLAKEIIVT
jgi:hypothetical protein